MTSHQLLQMRTVTAPEPVFNTAEMLRGEVAVFEPVLPSNEEIKARISKHTGIPQRHIENVTVDAYPESVGGGYYVEFTVAKYIVRRMEMERKAPKWHPIRVTWSPLKASCIAQLEHITRMPL